MPRPIRKRPTNARELAFVVLDDFKRREAFVTAAFEERASAAGLPPEERRLALEIVYGVVRRRATLNALIAPHSRRPRHQIEGRLWTFMQIGAYQLAFMTAIPAHAAVHATVEAGKRLGKSRWTGFLNGVLRSVDRSLTGTYSDAPAAEAVPLNDGRYRQYDRAVFPEPNADPAGYFTRAFSFPQWLAERWARRFPFEELCRLGFWFNGPAPLWLRVNRLKASRDDLMNALHGAGIDARPGNRPDSVRLQQSVRVDELPGYREGWFAVQDESAMSAAALLGPQPGESVLDLCAAPGTKTTQLAELMDNTGRIVATDVQPDRLRLVEENSRRLGVTIIEARPIRGEGDDVPLGPFDAALVDAPCSNTGVLGKRPDARWRIRREDLHGLPALQRRLLLNACDRLKVEGRVVYSTCSIEPEENREVVQAALLERPEMRLDEEIEHRPGRPADGAYQARLRRVVL